ncbi:MAG: hypothetical protein ACOYM3_22935 [Terrimicrobiaceae bacterium]
MTIPTFKKGEKLRAADLQILADAVRANRILPGAGIRVTGSPNGTTVAANIPRAVGGGAASLHKVDFEDMIPNPVTIAQEVMDDVFDAFVAALPTASAVADVVSGILSTALINALPTAAEIADAVAEMITSILTGLGSASSIADLFDELLTAVPNASAFATPILALFASAFDVLDRINEFVDAKFQEYVNVGALITNHFSRNGVKQPRPGDYLYTEEFGILYTLFPVDKETGIPTTNLIFRVHFSLGNAAQNGAPDTRATWCALTTFPAPDIAALCRMLARMLRMVITQGIQMAAAAASGSGQAVAKALAEGAGRCGDGAAEGVGEGILGALGDVSVVTPEGDGLVVKVFPPVTPLGDITETVYAVTSDGRQVAIRVFPVAVYGDSLGQTAYVIGADGRQMELRVFWAGYGQQLFTYPTLLGTDGNAHTVGVFGDQAGAFAPGHDIMYVGSDGQVWKAPHFFASTPQGITQRSTQGYIGRDGQGNTVDIIYFIGTNLPAQLSCPKVNVIDTAGHDREIMVVGTPADKGDFTAPFKYLDNNGSPQSVDAIVWNGPAVESGVTKEDIEVCENGTATTKKFLIAPAS